MNPVSLVSLVSTLVLVAAALTAGLILATRGMAVIDRILIVANLAVAAALFSVVIDLPGAPRILLLVAPALLVATLARTNYLRRRPADR